MCEWNNGGIVVNLPDNICKEKQNRTVCIDDCMVHVIEELWKHGYETLGCCCGHGKNEPDIIIADCYDGNEITKIRYIIQTVDERNINLLQWNLIKV